MGSDASDKHCTPTATDGTRARSPDDTPWAIDTPKGSAVGAASLLIVLQIGSRALTFIANQLLLRFLTAQLLGVSTQLEVYYLSVLFFARESLRVAIQRQATGDRDPGRGRGHQGRAGALPSGADDSQSVVNAGHLALGLGLVAAVSMGQVYLRSIKAATAAVPYLRPGLYMYAAAALVELLSEPAFVALQHRLRFGPRAAAESVATVLRCAITFAAANWAWRRGLELGVLPFALGQLGYGVGLLAVYVWYGTALSRAEGFSLWPRHATTGDATRSGGRAEGQYTLGYFYKPTLQLASSMALQSLVKHILTQGDTFLISILASAEAQGVYALTMNYGGLLARLVFQPVEESSRTYLSKLLAGSRPLAPSGAAMEGESGAGADKPASGSTSAADAVSTARHSMTLLLHTYALLSLLILTLGPPAAPLLIQLIAGPAWTASGAGRVLAQYCFYIPLLAVNGITEAFVSSVASEAEIGSQSVFMSAFSLAFGLAGWLFLRVLHLGAVGLVYANAINMTCRIIWSWRFIRTWFAKRHVRIRVGAILPRRLASYVAGAAMLWGVLARAGISLTGELSAGVWRDLFTIATAAVPYVSFV